MALRVELLGGLRLRQNGESRSIPISQKAGMLLGYLAYRLGDDVPRDVLIELLWPEVEPEAGRIRLRTVLSELRKLLASESDPEASFLIASRASVRLDSGLVECDAREFLRGIETSDVSSLEAAMALWQGELLPGAYDDWVLQERERLARARSKGLERLAAAYEHHGELDRAEEALVGLIHEEPLNEDAYCELMRLYLAAGKPAAALKQYSELERLLKEELDAEPSSWAQTLAASARSYRPPNGADRAEQAYAPDRSHSHENRKPSTDHPAPATERPSTRRPEPGVRRPPAWRWLVPGAALALIVGLGLFTLRQPAKRPGPAASTSAKPGDLLWIKKLDPRPGDTGSESIAITTDMGGRIFVTGMVQNEKTDVDIVTVCYDPDGNEVWKHYYDGPASDMDRPVAIHHALGGFVYVIGESENGKGNETPGASGFDWVVLKYRADLGTLSDTWPATDDRQGVRRYNGPQNGEDRPTHVARHIGPLLELETESVYVLGKSKQRGREPGTTEEDVVLVKFGPQGEREWVWKMAGPGDDTPAGLAVAESGDAYVAATTTRRPASGLPERDVLVARVSADGRDTWRKPYGRGNHADDLAHALAIDRGEEIHVFGFGPPPGVKDGVAGAFTLRHRPDGTLVRARGLSRPNERISQFGRALLIPGGALIIGHIAGKDGGEAYRLIRVGELGTTEWVADQGAYRRHDWGGRACVTEINYTRQVVFSVADDAAPPQAGRAIRTACYSPSGELLWEKAHGGAGPNHVPNAVMSLHDRLYIAGQVSRPDGGGDFAVLCYRS